MSNWTDFPELRLQTPDYRPHSNLHKVPLAGPHSRLPLRALHSVLGSARGESSDYINSKLQWVLERNPREVGISPVMPRNSWYTGDEENLFSKFKGVAIAIKTIFYKQNFPAKSSKLFG